MLFKSLNAELALEIHKSNDMRFEPYHNELFLDHYVKCKN